MNPKLYSLLLFACLVLPVGILIMVLSIEREQIRHQVKEQFLEDIDTEKLIKFSIHKKKGNTKIRWKHKNEFEHQEQMYDVVRRAEVGDSIIYYCFADDKETKINQDLDQVIAFTLGQQPNRQQQEAQLFSLFKSLFLSPQSAFEIGMSESKLAFFNKNNNCQTRTLSPAVPPPWT